MTSLDTKLQIVDADVTTRVTSDGEEARDEVGRVQLVTKFELREGAHEFKGSKSAARNKETSDYR